MTHRTQARRARIVRRGANMVRPRTSIAPVPMEDVLALETTVRELLRDFRGEQHELLPLLQAIQNRIGFIPSHAFQLIADALNLSRAEVYGVARFYHDLRDAPAGRTVV